MALIRGVDVARYQTITNWSKLKAAVDFVIVKATQGNDFTSPTWKGYFAGAKNAGVLRGSYHFADPNNGRGTAVQQADYYVKALKAAGFVSGRDLPPALDIERTGGLSKAGLTAWCLDFLNRVDSQLGLKEPWLKCGVYTNNDYRRNRYDGEKVLAGRWLWLANWPAAYKNTWPPESARPTGAALWQFSSSLHVPGITENVDTDVARLEDLKNLAPAYYGADPAPAKDWFDMATAAELQNIVRSEVQHGVHGYKVKPGPSAIRLGQYSDDVQKNGATLFQYAIGADCKAAAALRALADLADLIAKPMSDTERQALAKDISDRVGHLAVNVAYDTGEAA